MIHIDTKLSTARTIQLLFTSLGLLAFCLSLFSLAPKNTVALSGSQFSAGRIIDDSIFYNNSTMSAAQIQQFLNSKVPTCDTHGTQPYAGTTRAAYSASKGVSTPFICLKDYSQTVPAVTNSGSDLCGGNISAGTKSSAQIIYDVSQACGINPQVLLVLLQKEQSLITDDWPWPIQYRSATGYGCPDTAPCDSEFYGFFNQVYQAAKAYKRYQANPTNYNYRAGRNNTILWHPNSGCGTSQVYIENQATAGLYIYTPYRPNQAALNNLYGTGDVCSSYGNRNFWRMFNDWFGSTQGLMFNGISYASVFDADYYRNNYPDVNAAFGENQVLAFDHFVNHGMNEGRQAIADFNVISYKNRYPDLRRMYGDNLRMYYTHYALYGKAEARIATGDVFVGETVLNRVNYAAVYDFDYYQAHNPDIKRAFGMNDTLTLAHFVNHGMSEGRQAKVDFNVISYKNRYPDLRRVLGGNLGNYFSHYVRYGKLEARIATGDVFVGETVLSGIDYRSVYDFEDYVLYNGDIKKTYGEDDLMALWHFVNYGMHEGRQAKDDFNVLQYKEKYADLRAAFGNDFARYFWHYINHGVAEGRTSSS